MAGTYTSQTLALTESWDLDFDANGNLKMLNGSQAIVQNVCNECRLFFHDAYFRWEEGTDWFSDQLGKPLQTSVMVDRLRQAILRVDGVLSVEDIQLTEVDPDTRTLHGTITIQTEDEEYVTSNF